MSDAVKELETRDIKRRIVENSFIRRMKELRIDRPEYVLLCQALDELARRWRGTELVDREVAGTLHGIISTARNMIPTLGRTDPRLKDELEDMGITLNTLVQECFRKDA